MASNKGTWRGTAFSGSSRFERCPSSLHRLEKSRLDVGDAMLRIGLCPNEIS